MLGILLKQNMVYFWEVGQFAFIMSGGMQRLTFDTSGSRVGQLAVRICFEGS